MEIQNLRNDQLIKLSLSAVLLAGIVSEIKADTLYGPLKAGETLSSIVNENYLVSTFEDRIIMREIFRMNPQAFIYNNMGLVKQGIVLTLPSDDTIRRSRPAPSSSNASSSIVQSVPDAGVLTRLLESTLTQVRNERDQARLKIKRLETDFVTQSEVLNSTIGALESDNQRIIQQLSTAEIELTNLKHSLESIREDNAQLVVIDSSVVDSANADLIKQLDESKAVIAQKQQQIDTLVSSVAELKANTESLSVSHNAAVSQLQVSYAELEEKLTLQASSVTQSQSSLDQTAERQAALVSQHQIALDELKTSFDQELVVKAKLQDSLKAEVETLQADIVTNQSDFEILDNENSQLKLALIDSNTELEALSSENTVLQKLKGAASLQATALETEATQMVTIESPGMAVADTLLAGPLTKEVLVQRLEKPVEFPLWGLLLGAFALGFTSLMMLFTRSRKQAVQMTEKVSLIDNQKDSVKAGQEKLIFQAAYHTALQDPDTETLRVPPRRAPSRVAILDPTMENAADVSSGVVVAKEALSTEDSTNDSTISSEQKFEAKIKLLIAETYEEMGDLPAANDFFVEAQQEGDSEQVAVATDSLARLKQA